MEHLLPTYQRREMEAVQASGSYVWDAEGKKYLDFMMGIAVCGTGHRHPLVEASIAEQLGKVWHMSNLFRISGQETVAEQLISGTHFKGAFFCNSGAEANEGAYKLVRKWTGRNRVVSFSQSFHGRTFAMMGATGQEKIKQGFGPMVEGFDHVSYNSFEALEAITEQTAAVWIELIQGEGGVILADDTWLDALMERAQRVGAKIVVDEVQTGIGRTGTRYAYESTPLIPDVVTLAKGLGSGFPVGAILAAQGAEEVFTPGTHGSTFGGNPLAMAAAKATLELLFDQSALEHIEETGRYLMDRLSKLKTPSIVDVRGKGLMVGIEMTEEVAPVIDALQHEGLLVAPAGPNVIRLLPSLFVTKEEIDQAIRMMEHVLEQKAGVRG